MEDGLLFSSEEEDGLKIFLRSSVPLKVSGNDGVAEFQLRAGESASFVLEKIHEGVNSPAASLHYVAEAFKKTATFWRNWIAKSTYLYTTVLPATRISTSRKDTSEFSLRCWETGAWKH